MKIAAGKIVIAVAAALIATSAAFGEIHITDDRGGTWREYSNRVNAARASGERVVIDGPCHSACTLWLNLPPEQICATKRAVFGFHSARDEWGLPHPATNEKLYDVYPPKVRSYILRRGGLWLDPIYAPGTMFVAACR